MAEVTHLDFITNEWHKMREGFVEMGKRIEVMDARAKYRDELNDERYKNQQERISDLLLSNKDIMKAINKNQTENSKAIGQLWIKVTAISTTLGVIITFFAKKILMVGI